MKNTLPKSFWDFIKIFYLMLVYLKSDNIPNCDLNSDKFLDGDIKVNLLFKLIV